MKKSSWVVLSVLLGVGAGAAARRARAADGVESEGPVAALQKLRTALSIYYGETEGVFPRQISDLTVNGTFLKAIPILGQETDERGVHRAAHFPHPPTKDFVAPGRPADSGKWSYIREAGALFIDCTHKDTTGIVWSTW